MLHRITGRKETSLIEFYNLIHSKRISLIEYFLNSIFRIQETYVQV